MLSKKLDNFDSQAFMIPNSVIFPAGWLSMNHLTSEPSQIGANDSRNHRQPRRVVWGVHLKIEKGENICNSTK